MSKPLSFASLRKKISSALALGAFAGALGLLGTPALAASTGWATLFTPPLFPDGANQLDCYLLNSSGVARDARIDVFPKDGEVVGSEAVTLAPGIERVVTMGAYLAPRYCKFQVEGKRTDFRASVLVREPGRGSISALAAQ